MSELVIQILSGIISISIILYCVYSFFNGLIGNYKPLKINDNIQLGYIELDNKVSKLETNTKCYILPDREIKKLKKQIKILQNKIEEKSIKKDNILFNDCVSALMALGTKKKLAIEEVSKYFKTHTPNNVEEFINNFFKDRHDKSHCSD